MSEIRDRIVQLANRYVGTIGVFRHLSPQQLIDAGSDDANDVYQLDALRGADLLIRIINEAAPSIMRWSPERERALRDGKWIYLTPTSSGKAGTYDESEPGRFDWCGIFTAWIWMQAGINVTWVRDYGIDSIAVPKPFELVQNRAQYRKPGFIRRGDICVMNNPGMNNQHYYIVVDEDFAGMRTVEGNLSLPRQAIAHRRRTRDLIVSHYRLLVD